MGQGPAKFANSEKNLRSSVTTRRKSWERIPVLGSYLKFKGQIVGYLSPIVLEAKLGPRHEFQRQILGLSPPPPDLLIWKYPLEFYLSKCLNLSITSTILCIICASQNVHEDKCKHEADKHN